MQGRNQRHGEDEPSEPKAGGLRGGYSPRLLGAGREEDRRECERDNDSGIETPCAPQVVGLRGFAGMGVGVGCRAPLTAGLGASGSLTSP